MLRYVKKKEKACREKLKIYVTHKNLVKSRRKKRGKTDFLKASKLRNKITVTYFFSNLVDDKIFCLKQLEIRKYENVTNIRF